VFCYQCLYSTFSSFLVINVCNQGKTLCSSCIYCIPLYVSSTIVLVFRENNCVSTPSGVVTVLCTEQYPKDSDDTRCCNNTIVLLKMSTVVLETCTGM